VGLCVVVFQGDDLLPWTFVMQCPRKLLNRLKVRSSIDGFFVWQISTSMHLSASQKTVHMFYGLMALF
jgi:hypothetical protein